MAGGGRAKERPLALGVEPLVGRGPSGAMHVFAVHFEFRDPPAVHEEPRFELAGATLAEAKLEAALLFAVGDFGTSPEAYCILQNGEIEVYRYPELGTDPVL
jgi:hypothetical protein